MKKIAIIGGGPAGLFAAEYLCQNTKHDIHLYDQKPSVGRKFLIAGRGGLNLTHSEPLPQFMSRYGDSAKKLQAHIEAFTPDDLRQWAAELGSTTFVGSSGRVFPEEMKASKLMRAWTSRLLKNGLQAHLGYQLTGMNENGALEFKTRDGADVSEQADAVLFAMGGGSYPHLGASGHWVEQFKEADIAVEDLAPMNCGFNCDWSEFLIQKFAGAPLKNIGIRFEESISRGDLIVSEYGLEGGAIYALSRALVRACAADQTARIYLDLLPDITQNNVQEKLNAPRNKLSFSNYLRKKLKLSPLQIALLHEAGGSASLPADELGKLLKNLPLDLTSPRPIRKAISSMGGVKWSALDAQLMITTKPGYFAAGEMIDWDAPTGGYLLQACFSTGLAAAKGIESWLDASA